MAGFLLTNICLAGASLALVAEKEDGTYEQMLAQPATALQIILGKLLPNVGISYVALTMAMIGAGLIFDYWPQGNVLLFAAATLPFILATLAIGTFVSALARTSAQAIFIAVFFIMPSFVLSGSMLPYALMPPVCARSARCFRCAGTRSCRAGSSKAGAGPAEIMVPVRCW
jgi:ABC-2 type transport system permease protein